MNNSKSYIVLAARLLFVCALAYVLLPKGLNVRATTSVCRLVTIRNTSPASTSAAVVLPANQTRPSRTGPLETMCSFIVSIHLEQYDDASGSRGSSIPETAGHLLEVLGL